MNELQLTYFRIWVSERPYLALANPLCVWALLFFARSDRLKFAHFVWNVIDYMYEPDFYWDVLDAKMRS